MLRRISGFAIVAIALLLIVGCSGGNMPAVNPDSGNEHVISHPPVVPPDACVTPIIAGQHYYVGDMYYWPTVGNPAQWNIYLVINQDTECSWYLGTCEEEDDSATHLFVDWDAPWPDNDNWKSFPAPGQMPYNDNSPELHYSSAYERYYIVTLPPEVGGDPDVYIAAHAVVRCDDWEGENEGEGEGFSASGYCYVEVDSTDLIAGQHFDAGDISIWLTPDEENGGVIHVKYSTQDGWKLFETHLFIGCDQPTQSAPGQFPFGEEDLGGVDEWEWSMPMSDLLDFLCDPDPDAPKKYDSQCLDEDENCILVWGEDIELCFAAHAVVMKQDESGEWQEETGWGEGEDMDGNNWAMYWCSPIEWDEFCSYDDPIEPDPSTNCETSWAQGNQYFPDPPVNNPRWGWWIRWPEYCPPQEP